MIASRSRSESGPHVEGHVGDGDDRFEAAFVGGVFVGFGPDRVVVIARVGRVDGDERDFAQVDAAFDGGRRRAFGFVDDVGGELIGDAVGVDGDQADRLGFRHAADAFDDARARLAHGAPGQGFAEDEFAVERAAGVAFGDHEVVARFLVDRFDAAVAAEFAEDAERLVGGHAQALDDACFVAFADALQAREEAFADAERAAFDGPVRAGGKHDASAVWRRYPNSRGGRAFRRRCRVRRSRPR